MGATSFLAGVFFSGSGTTCFPVLNESVISVFALLTSSAIFSGATPFEVYFENLAVYSSEPTPKLLAYLAIC